MSIHPFPQTQSTEHLALVESSTDGVESVPSSGFFALLENASLDDLLQLECQSCRTGVLSVSSSTNHEGYLHLEAGELIHAEVDELQGEEALFHILSWRGGRFQQCPVAVSKHRTIDKPLELLLLMRTKRVDEAANAPDEAEPHKLPFNHSRPTTTTVRVRRASHQGAVNRRNATDVMVSSSGRILEWKGPNVEEFASQAAYATRLGALIGSAIGSGQPSQIELCGSKTRTIVFRLPEGTLAASRYVTSGAEGS